MDFKILSRSLIATNASIDVKINNVKIIRELDILKSKTQSR